MDTQIIAFEYNEEEGIFHENIGCTEENTNGYRTVCKTYYHVWDPFNRMIKRNRTFDKPVSFDEIKSEWEDYLTLRKDIEECNNSQE